MGTWTVFFTHQLEDLGPSFAEVVHRRHRRRQGFLVFRSTRHYGVYIITQYHLQKQSFVYSFGGHLPPEHDVVLHCLGSLTGLRVYVVECYCSVDSEVGKFKFLAAGCHPSVGRPSLGQVKTWTCCPSNETASYYAVLLV